MKIIRKIKYLPLELAGWLLNRDLTKKFVKNFLCDEFYIRVLCYHDIPDNKVGLFERQIAFLKKEHRVINIINAQQLRDFFRGRGFLPGVNVLVTFDDGSVDHYTNVAPILEKYGFSGCFFINTDDIERGDFIASRPGSKILPMSWEQVRDLAERGHTIGSHGARHYDMTKLQPCQIYDELNDSKKVLEKKIGGEADFFAFPSGTDKELSQESILIAGKIFDFNFIFLPGKNQFISANRYLIRRTGVSPDFSINHLRALISGTKDFLYRRRLGKLERFLDAAIATWER
jgi:peptidoglycan/xylan/chitin deacetylase (PgdA/CDA1 family)